MVFCSFPPLSDTCDSLAPIFDYMLHFHCILRQFAISALCYFPDFVFLTCKVLLGSSCSLNTNVVGALQAACCHWEFVQEFESVRTRDFFFKYPFLAAGQVIVSQSSSTE